MLQDRKPAVSPNSILKIVVECCFWEFTLWNWEMHLEDFASDHILCLWSCWAFEEPYQFWMLLPCAILPAIFGATPASIPILMMDHARSKHKVWDRSTYFIFLLCFQLQVCLTRSQICKSTASNQDLSSTEVCALQHIIKNRYRLIQPCTVIMPKTYTILLYHHQSTPRSPWPCVLFAAPNKNERLCNIL